MSRNSHQKLFSVLLPIFILSIVVSSLLSVVLETQKSSGYVLGEKTSVENRGFFYKILKFLGLVREEKADDLRLLEYVPSRLKGAPEIPTAPVAPPPAPSTSTYQQPPLPSFAPRSTPVQGVKDKKASPSVLPTPQ